MPTRTPQDKPPVGSGGSRHVRFSRRILLAAGAPATLLIVAAFWIAYQFVQPAPPKRVTIATGATDGAYHAFGEQYGRVVAKSGITLEVRKTAGSVENLGLLADPRSDVPVALVQGGLATPEHNPGLVCLGVVFLEPVWVFYRDTAELDRLEGLRGRRIAIGPVGSGLHVLAGELLEANEMAGLPTQLFDLPTREATDALLAGLVDAVLVVAAAQSETVQRLLRAEGVRLMDLARAEGYARRFPHLAMVTLPEGAVDLARNIPPQDTRLLASRANLVAREDLHPALITVLLDAAERVHGGSGLFSAAGEFPSARGTDLAVPEDARRFYKSGRPFLQRYLPFWAAVFIDRMLVMLLPLVAVLLPVFRILPMLYSWRVRSRIYRRYGELRYLEEQIDTSFDPGRTEDYLRQIDRMEQTVNRSHTPVSYSDLLYNFRLHAGIVREKIAARQSGQAVGGAA